MKKKPTVTIGIPAYNEEANIKNLLLNLLEQKQTNFTLKEIIVVSDASSDKTDEEVLSFKNRIIKLIRHSTRQGQASCQNEILNNFTGDILVLLNADILPSNDIFLNKIIQPFLKDKNVGIVGGKVTPIPGRTYFEKVINYSMKMKQSLYEQINHGENIYLCHGRVRAFSKSFANTFRWQTITSEDAFSYLSCIVNGFKFVYQPAAEIFYRSPKHFRDHFSQSARFLQSQEQLCKYFKKETVEDEYIMPIDLQIKIALKYLIINPIYFISYSYILLLSKIIAWKFFSSDAVWNPSHSSKKLVIDGGIK